MPGPVFLEGDRVTLHPVEEADLDFLQTCVNHPQVRRGIASVEPQTERDEREWFESIDTEEDVPLLVCAAGPGGDEENRVGQVGLHRVNGTFGSAEIGYYLHPDAWGNGYATDAVRQAVAYGFRERRLHKVSARCYAHNDASRRLLGKAGFEREGVRREQAFVDGEYVDVYRYGLLEDEWARGERGQEGES